MVQSLKPTLNHILHLFYIEKQGLAMRLGKEGGLGAALLRNHLTFWSSHPARTPLTAGWERRLNGGDQSRRLSLPECPASLFSVFQKASMQSSPLL
ncbi:MAG: hypothetical protein KKG96_06270, partial [Proteobacteria bacterium]|nr:hypothetical protein [Pseudomonadota bacterium]MBU1965645.1 hypothetical protein [Pseudomonadota bacterium]